MSRENKVSQEDDSWTVITNPKSWRGISIFGAIALAEALHYHGHILDKATHKAWTTNPPKKDETELETSSLLGLVVLRKLH